MMYNRYVPDAAGVYRPTRVEDEKVFNETFGGYFIKVGWDQDLLAGK